MLIFLDLIHSAKTKGLHNFVAVGRDKTASQMLMSVTPTKVGQGSWDYLSGLVNHGSTKYVAEARTVGNLMMKPSLDWVCSWRETSFSQTETSFPCSRLYGWLDTKSIPFAIFECGSSQWNNSDRGNSPCKVTNGFVGNTMFPLAED